MEKLVMDENCYRLKYLMVKRRISLGIVLSCITLSYTEHFPQWSRTRKEFRTIIF